jgi:hypothetical protein
VDGSVCLRARALSGIFWRGYYGLVVLVVVSFVVDLSRVVLWCGA